MHIELWTCHFGVLLVIFLLSGNSNSFQGLKARVRLWQTERTFLNDWTFHRFRLFRVGEDCFLIQALKFLCCIKHVFRGRISRCFKIYIHGYSDFTVRICKLAQHLRRYVSFVQAVVEWHFIITLINNVPKRSDTL